ncbi:alpha-1-antiproteinase-like [Peromyscus maniculatus bairdii]|uniref:Serpin domain-containing protein n=1 Tax=Peromyscus maniculatus bairdii TaxID=230844 RepID=A0A8C8UKE0_PERMB
MSSSVPQRLLWLAGLCCLFSGSQPQDSLQRDEDEHDYGSMNYGFCESVYYNIFRLTFTLYQKSDSWTKDTNILFSPVNIIVASLIISLGAKNNTHNQILEGLQLNITEPTLYTLICMKQLLHNLLKNHKPQHLTIKSSIFLDQNLKLVDFFANAIHWLNSIKPIPVNFNDTYRAQKQINEYVEDETQGKIVGLFKDLEKDKAFALMNYIFFQGKEYDEAEAEHTLEEDFHVNKYRTVKVLMINRRDIYLLYREEELSTWVVANPYRNEVIAIFMLPDQGKMKRLEETLNQNYFENIMRLLKVRTANVYFPKLAMSTTYDLEIILSTLGITQAFSNEADLSGITQDAPVKLNKALQKTVLTFSNKSTKATRNTGLSEGNLTKVPTIRFDKPFLVFIKNEITGVPLIVGRVTNPTENSCL